MSSASLKRDIDEVSESFDQDALVTPELKKKKKKSEFVFELGGKKKVSVGHYKGTILVNIREYYTDQKTGELKPGSKGIALNALQFIELRSQVGAISDAIEELEDLK